MAVKRYEADGQTFWLVDEWIYVNGKRTRFRKWRIPTREAAEALAAKVRIDSFEGRHFEKAKAQSTTFAECWESYRPHAERTRTARNIRIRIRRLLEAFGTRPVASLTHADFEAWRGRQGERVTIRGTPPSPATLDWDLSLAKMVLNHALRAGLIASNPWHGVRPISAPNARSMVLDEAGFQRLLRHLPPYLRPVMTVAFDGGFRIREVLCLEWSRVDLEGGAILLGSSDTKTAKGRTVPLTPRALEALSAQSTRTGLVFPSPKTGRAIHNPYRAWWKACEDAGLEGLTIHDLRRSFVTRARRAGVPETVVMRLTGHQTANVFRRYSIVDEADVRAAISLLGTVSGQRPAGRDVLAQRGVRVAVHRGAHPARDGDGVVHDAKGLPREDRPKPKVR